MDLPTPVRRAPREAILPMINVVFLLLIFFLMTASMTPPEASDIAPPESRSGSEMDLTTPLLVAADGTVTWGKAAGEDALARVGAIWADAAAQGASPTLVIRADRAVEGARIAALLNELTAAGVERSALVTGAPQ